MMSVGCKNVEELVVAREGDCGKKQEVKQLQKLHAVVERVAHADQCR